jgi:hypothetical protein
MTKGTTPTSQTGNHIGVQQHLLSFEVLDVQPFGLDAKNKERYWVKVKYGDGKLAAFHTQSKSLKTAFEMIEVVGQQTKNLNPAEFKEYINSVQGKRIWFDMTNESKNPAFKKDRVIAYKANRHGHSLEYAFSETKGFSPTITINNTIIDELKRVARLHQTQVDSSANLDPNNVRVVLKRKAHDNSS